MFALSCLSQRDVKMRKKVIYNIFHAPRHRCTDGGDAKPDTTSDLVYVITIGFQFGIVDSRRVSERRPRVQLRRMAINRHHRSDCLQERSPISKEEMRSNTETNSRLSTGNSSSVQSSPRHETRHQHLECSLRHASIRSQSMMKTRVRKLPDKPAYLLQ